MKRGRAHWRNLWKQVNAARKKNGHDKLQWDAFMRACGKTPGTGEYIHAFSPRETA